MGFVEGMVLCIIGGWLNSLLYSKYLRKKNKGWIFWFAIIWVGGLITFDFLIYIDIIDARWFEVIPWIDIPDTVSSTVIGRYWMFTPGAMIGFPIPMDTNFYGPVWHIFALFLFISYIWWFTIGQNLGRFMYGRLEYEKGAWYLMRSTKMIKRSMDKMETKRKQEKQT